MRERQEEAAATATKAVSKHYRRASVRVHPDRYGSKFMRDFDTLQEAYQVLGDSGK
jgi:DnaJ-class molecular chaperone